MSINCIDRSNDEEIIDIIRGIMSNGTGKAETVNEHILLKLMQLRNTPINNFAFDQERVDYHYNTWKKDKNMTLDLENIYKYHAPKGNQNEKYEALRAKAKELAEMINEFCPESREQSIAFTNLETAIMWANAAIARS